MELATFSYHPDRKWSVPALPALDSDRTLVLVFAAPETIEHPAPLQELARAFPQSCIIGCSTAGEIAGRQVEDGSISVAVARFAHARVATAATCITESGSREAGERLGRQLDPAGLRAVIVLAEGLDVNGSEFTAGLSGSLPRGVMVTGGLAGDGARFQGTWVLDKDGAQRGAAVAAGLYGERLHIGIGSHGGWQAFGPERRITRASGNVLYELDHEPALALYKQYLGEHAARLPGSALNFPLAIRAPGAPAETLVRCIAGVDEKEQSITFAGDMPAGYLARLMRADFEHLIAGGAGAAAQARGDATAGGPTLALIVSCAGRREVLGERAEDEVAAAARGLPAGSLQAGFYAYGEIAPYAGRLCDLHNQTITLTTLSEV